MKSWGNHEGYRYAHDWPGAVAPQQYMPDELAGREYYHPNDRGYEHEIKPRLEKIRKILHEKNGDRADRFFPPPTSSPISVYNADLVNVNIRSCSTWRASLGKLGRSVEGNDEAMRNMQDESNQRLIMIVDDDQALGEMLSIVLESEGFKTVTCLDGWRAVEMFPTLQPDLMLLDVMLPGLDGVQVAQRIRQNSNTPIIMLTAKSDTTDVVKRPWKRGRMIMCPNRSRWWSLWPESGSAAHAQGKRACRKDEGDLTERLQCGTLVMDRAEHTATKDGVDLQLTPTEFELLYVLAAHAGEA